MLYSSVFRDGEGASFVPHDVAARVRSAANAPVYGFVDQYLGSGIVGGHLYTLDTHGEQAAKVTLKVLAGAEPAALALAEPPAGQPQFDVRQLERWSLDERELPAGSVVLFRETRYRASSASMIGAVALGTLQALYDCCAARCNGRGGGGAEAELREGDFRFQSMADMAPVLIWIVDADRNVTFFNKGWRNCVGDAWPGTPSDSWTSCVHPNDCRVRSRSMNRASRPEGPSRWSAGYEGTMATIVGCCAQGCRGSRWPATFLATSALVATSTRCAKGSRKSNGSTRRWRT